MFRIIKTIPLILLTGLIAASCDSTSSVPGEEASLMLQMQVQTQNITAKYVQGQQDVSGLTIDEVKLYIDEMELESIENDSLDFEIEDFIVNLPLDGSPLTLTEQALPQGIYDEFELEIEKAEDDINVSDSDFRDETGTYSLVVLGTFNGESFIFRSTDDFELELELNPPLELTGGESSILQVTADVSSWFKGASGEDLDPNNADNFETINQNIENSFEGYEDDVDDDDDDDGDDD
ncbi:hypothetical protein [Rhodohalobacter mucosus]|uniref:DUF4382 domain-containing protein n=1 Tax=Rhodohalobacter mucosus TaxID=2079485 RepID=A0A316TS99_9BACT|nr:hypothetical protein [Rhodohalobacter mucosus]PWN06199.1 hypothetical protein DDZ15_10210 [Rhodohalobacter mucosus]